MGSAPKAVPRGLSGLAWLAAAAFPACHASAPSPRPLADASEASERAAAAPPATGSAAGALVDGDGDGSARASRSWDLPLATVSLIDPGRPPRRKLRYAWRLGARETLSLDLRSTASTASAAGHQPDAALPEVTLAIDVDPESVSPDGDLRYAWRVASATVLTDADTSPIAAAMRGEVQGVARLAGDAVVTARGLTTEVRLGAGSDAGGEGGAGGRAGPMVEQVRETLRDVAAPLPEQAVGVGARWRKVSELDAHDAEVTQRETFRLVELRGDRGTLDDALTQAAPAQILPSSPGAPPGAPARLDSMIASGQATVRFDLSRLVPQSSFDGTTTMVLAGSAGAGGPTTTVRMRLHVGIEGSLR